MSRNFTIFQPGFDSAVFNKDVGLIPIVFQNSLDYNCSFLCNWIKDPKNEVIKNNMQVILIDNEETIVRALKNTDILMLYGIYDYNLEIITKYKIIKPEGKIYLKLDMNIHWLKNIQMNDNLIESLKSCTLITVECRSLEKYIEKHWPVKVEYIPNGYYDFSDSTINYEDKENTIITVGRLGSHGKATEVLLKAFKLAAARLTDWKLKLVGGIEDSFKPFIEELFKNDPQLKDRIIFTGKIDDRKLLEEEYKKSKVFCLTSRYEGFPNVFPESAVKGCYIISSDIDPAYDITNNKKYGSLFPIDDFEDLSKVLINVCSNEELLKQTSSDIQKYTKENFNWVSLCERIEYYLNMPLSYRELMPHIIKRVTLESPLSILDLCKYPMGHAVLAEENLNNSRSSLIVDRIDFDKSNNYLLYKNIYNQIYDGNIIDNIDSMSNYDVILISNVLEHFSKDNGFLLIDKLLRHTNKMLIITTPKSLDDKNLSRWSFIDFYKYNFSCSTVNVQGNEIFIFNFYPLNNKINAIDKMYNDFKVNNSLLYEDNKKLNIAYILPHRAVTGGLKILIKQMKLLKDRGHTITGILQGNYTGSIFPDTNKIEIDKELIIGHNEKIDDYLKGYDVIVTGFINDWMNIENKKLPVILFEQGYETLFGEYKAQSPNIERNHKLYFDGIYSNRENLIVSVSSVLSDILYYRYGRICEAIPNGIDASMYFPIKKSEGSTTKILLIGSPYLDFKGFDLAIKVLKKLTELSYKLEITWICQERPFYHVPLNISYIVNPKEGLLAKTIRENDILLSTSWYESFALPPLEAMASGTAVVATDNGGIRTYSKHGYNCMLVEPGDVNGLLTSLISLILDVNKRNNIISNGLKTASEFSIENMIITWEKMLNNVSSFYKL
ncbi:glycosyltransferase family 4 protein [Candidatus Clostridium radicumherbarum]|uniref:Glycosyltransferase family 4 protein n=1 Tax=Candidatus Clostridium radicumherbarum TaxID=3381662 RepID=A0ABW8TNK7_9CLOT